MITYSSPILSCPSSHPLLEGLILLKGGGGGGIGEGGGEGTITSTYPILLLLLPSDGRFYLIFCHLEHDTSLLPPSKVPTPPVPCPSPLQLVLMMIVSSRSKYLQTSQYLHQVCLDQLLSCRCSMCKVQTCECTSLHGQIFHIYSSTVKLKPL